MAAVPPLPKSFEEAARRDLAVAEELERVCNSSDFRASRRSCEFLRYIVRVTLDGRMDSLKERSIGIDLFGRDISYEPSSDATVRVRANEVRKRLLSYYASSAAASATRTLRIDLPTGSYVPRFLFPASSADAGYGFPTGSLAPTQLSADQHVSVPVFFAGRSESPADQVPAHPSRMAPSLSHPALFQPAPADSTVPPMQVLTLMRPALLALLVCTLLLRHQLEIREEYLRFWDRLLSGRGALVLSVPPQDRATLASSLYPLVWVAGRYGVDAILQGDSLAGARQEAASSVQVSFAAPPGTAADRRVRWANAVAPGPGVNAKPQAALLDRKFSDGKTPARTLVSSWALLTILPEDTSTLRIEGTDADAIRRLLQEFTEEPSFPAGMVERIERLDSRHALQVLVLRDLSGEWRREVSWGDV